jgi:hypothetical protein
VSYHELTEFSGEKRVKRAIDELAGEVAQHLVVEHYDDPPVAYLEYVTEQARVAIVDGLDATRVLDLEEYGADQELEDRAALDRERAIEL